MAEIVVREIDSQGRVSIPARWRKSFKSRKLALIKREDKIEIVSIEALSPSALFDSINVSEHVDFTDPHSLRKALMEYEKR
jgi:bifunctional DNA-binding transcriptional regulator/antitoxin component of YhaV-PrlF toxin-antitoxin module